MYPFRSKTPKHRKNCKVYKRYTSYRKFLQMDFFRRCGYCNDFDLNFKLPFVIDHFVPQNPKNFSHTIPPNNYYNLIYSCAYCNRAKWDKWPTNDAKIHNDGNIGFILPTQKLYSSLFARERDGSIIVKNNSTLGKYILFELRLDQPIHSMNWKFEKFLNQEKELEKLFKITQDINFKNEIQELRNLRLQIIDSINEMLQ